MTHPSNLHERPVFMTLPTLTHPNPGTFDEQVAKLSYPTDQAAHLPCIVADSISKADAEVGPRSGSRRICRYMRNDWHGGVQTGDYEEFVVEGALPTRYRPNTSRPLVRLWSADGLVDTGYHYLAYGSSVHTDGSASWPNPMWDRLAWTAWRPAPLWMLEEARLGGRRPLVAWRVSNVGRPVSLAHVLNEWPVR